MTAPSFSELIEATGVCNKELYRCCDEEHWDACIGILSTRNDLFNQLTQLTPTLKQGELDILASLYHKTLESDKIYLTHAESEMSEVKRQLRHIKRAEVKALPTYRKHS